jgi:ribonuclease BN (tRNA processing enzyme)
LKDLTVKVAENSHYQNQQHTQDTPGYISLSFRFDGADRSIVFTGDTGPSNNVVELAKQADLLVTEMMDIDLALANIKRINPHLNASTLQAIETHFRAHHLTPDQVAAMAVAAEVKNVVITHFAPGASTPEQAQQYRNQMQNIFKGTIDFANDLNQF